MKRRIIPRIISRFGIEIRMNAQFRYVAGASTQDTSLHPPFHPRLGLARTCWPLRAPCPSATRRLPSTYDEAQSQPRPAPVVSVSRRPDPSGGPGGGARVCDTRAEPGDRVASSRWVDVPTAQNLPRPGALRLLDVVRWLLPLVLAVVAWTFEWTEHVSSEHEPLTPGFYGEVLLFGVVGPVVVAIVLTWVRRLVVTLEATTSALEAVNRDLETIVAERTANLQAATGELADRNRQLARANEELRELDRMKSDFVSLVSHQLRAPLTNINGALELVSQDAELLPAASQRTLRILAEEGHRLSHMIETILDVSRLEAGQLTPSAGPVALEPLLARVCASVVANEADRRDWKLEVTPG